MFHTQPTHLAQGLISYGTPGLLTKTESMSPQTPSSTSKSPVPLKSVQTLTSPTDQQTQPAHQQQKDDEMFYLAIPKSEMSCPEVKSLLGENSPSPDKDKDSKKDNMFIPAPARVKQEPITNRSSATVPETDPVDKTVPSLDPFIIPEGEGMVDG